MNASEFDPGACCPLDEVRVLDLSRLVAGNILTHVLADLGADVIKVEKPGRGDDLRNWITNGVPLWWQVYARNKRSLCLDLRQTAGCDLLLRLAETGQILVENYRPGTLEKMGLGPDVLLARNPQLVIVRVSGWGQTGPFRDKPGFGSLIEAFSGFAAMNGFADRPPVLPAFAMADAFAGLYGALAALTALRVAERGGPGQVIDLALLEPILAVLGPKAAEYRLTGATTPRMGSRCTIQAPRDVYRTRDGRYLALSTGTQAMAERLLRAIGRADLLDDPRFRTNAGPPAPPRGGREHRRGLHRRAHPGGSARLLRAGRGHGRAGLRRGRPRRRRLCRRTRDPDRPPRCACRPPADAQRRAAPLSNPGRAAPPRAAPRRAQRRDPAQPRLLGRRDRGADRDRSPGRFPYLGSGAVRDDVHLSRNAGHPGQSLVAGQQGRFQDLRQRQIESIIHGRVVAQFERPRQKVRVRIPFDRQRQIVLERDPGAV